ncbi:MAG: hypothetical protein KC609_11770 [Myxococcales bacterium]|nr:hypothetical protein [Myxococcales bacterium]
MSAGLLLAASLVCGFAPLGLAAWVALVVGACALLLPLVAYVSWRLRDRVLPLRWWIGIILVALAARVAVCFSGPILSDDIGRYHWDGKVLWHGINPYLYAPHAEELDKLPLDPWDQRVNHPWYHTVYPPLSQLLFALAYRLDPSGIAGLHLLFLVAELLGFWLLWGHLGRRGSPRSGLLLLWLNPLLVFEGYAPGHLDLWLLPCVALLIGAVLERRAVSTGLALGCIALIKPLALLFTPACMRELGWRKTVLAGIVCVALIAVGYAPFLAAGERLYSSMLRMANEWTFNGSLAAWLESLHPTKHAVAHKRAALVMLSLILLATWLARDWLARAIGASLAWIICTPVLFPWYLIGFAPLVALRGDPALLVAFALAPLSELVVVEWQLAGHWHPLGWASWVLYLAFYGVLLGALVSRRGVFAPKNVASGLDGQRSSRNAPKT